MKEQEPFWAIVSICVHPNRKHINESGNYETNHYHWHTLRQWDYPKWIIDRHRKFFVWVQAIYQVRFPNNYISFRYYGYKKAGEDSDRQKIAREIAAAKAQVTKVENAIKEYQAERSATLFSDLSTDEIYLKLTCKLEQKKFLLQQAVLSEH